MYIILTRFSRRLLHSVTKCVRKLCCIISAIINDVMLFLTRVKIIAIL